MDRPIIFSAHERRWRSVAARMGIPINLFVNALNSGSKHCGGCYNVLERNAENFGKESKQFDGLRSRCRTCVSASKKAHYQETRPQQRAKQLRYQRENREKIYAYNAQWQRKTYRALRTEALAAYGGKCGCCGESEPIFLDLDHIYNDGAAHRRQVGNTMQVLIEAKKAGWPTNRIQLLCCNCNQGKARNGGICPHQGNHNDR